MIIIQELRKQVLVLNQSCLSATNFYTSIKLNAYRIENLTIRCWAKTCP